MMAGQGDSLGRSRPACFTIKLEIPGAPADLPGAECQCAEEAAWLRLCGEPHSTGGLGERWGGGMAGSEEGCGLCRAHPSGCFLPGPHATPPAGGRHAPRGLVPQGGREGGGIWRVRCSRGGWR